MIYFTSDTHFGHANIIEYSKRPYKDVKEMDEALIKNWNETVSPTDTVYHLGDVMFSKDYYILDRLNGTKYFLWGNHDSDRFIEQLDKRSLSLKDYHEFKYNGHLFVLCHFPLLTWNKARKGSIHLHGHIHSTVPIYSNVARYDVGVDANNYKPVSIEQIIEAFRNLRDSPMNPDELPPLDSSRGTRGV